MLSKVEWENLSAEEQAFYQNAGMFDKAKIETTLREKALQRIADRSSNPNSVSDEQSPAEALSGKPKREYKIFTSHDKGLFGKFDPESIEIALNAYAKQGWIVVASSTATFRGWVSPREELVIVLERVLDAPQT